MKFEGGINEGLTSSKWGCLFGSAPKLVLGQPNDFQYSFAKDLKILISFFRLTYYQVKLKNSYMNFKQCFSVKVKMLFPRKYDMMFARFWRKYSCCSDALMFQSLGFHQEVSAQKSTGETISERVTYAPYHARSMWNYHCCSILVFPHFSVVLRFYTPWKPQKTKVFLAFSSVTELEHWVEMG